MVIKKDLKKVNFSGFIGLSTDWEDQVYFIEYENRYTKASKIHNFFQTINAFWLGTL